MIKILFVLHCISLMFLLAKIGYDMRTKAKEYYRRRKREKKDSSL